MGTGDTEMLNAEQKSVLTWMRRENIGAVCFDGGYKFPDHFRRSPELAHKFLQAGIAKPIGTKMLRAR
jgi:hypothetical protein